MFTKINLIGNPTHNVSCLCRCHDKEPIQTCEVQIFRQTTDAHEAVDSIYYREDYDYSTDEETESETKIVCEKILDLNLMLDNNELMNTFVKDALEKLIDDNSFLKI